MPFVDVTEIILNDEAKELEQMLENSEEARQANEQFKAEYKLRQELVKARKSKNITQKELEKRTGLTQQVISRIESDGLISPSLKNLVKYVSALGYELTIKPSEENAINLK